MAAATFRTAPRHGALVMCAILMARTTPSTPTERAPPRWRPALHFRPPRRASL